MMELLKAADKGRVMHKNARKGDGLKARK